MVPAAADHVLGRIDPDQPKVGTSPRKVHQKPPRTGSHVENCGTTGKRRQQLIGDGSVEPA